LTSQAKILIILTLEIEKPITKTPENKFKVHTKNPAGALAAMAVAEDLAKGHEVKIPSLGISLTLETTS